MYGKKIVFGILLAVVVVMENIQQKTVDNSVITCDEITEEETKTVTTNFNEKNEICKTKILYILPDILSITVALLIVVKIYYYQIKYKAK